MSQIERLILQDGDETFEVFVQSTTPTEQPTTSGESEHSDSEYESYGPKEDLIVHLNKVHGTIRAYARYAIGAFKNLGGAEVEEITLKFGLKIGGKTGIPILTEGSAESNFEIQVKCKFPDSSNLQS
jgi:hypothetical protein